MSTCLRAGSFGVLEFAPMDGGNSHSGPDHRGQLGVLALASIYPHARRPHQGSFNRQQYQALAGLCRFGLVAPIAFRQRFSGQKTGLPQPGFPITRPIYWYPPGMLRAAHGGFYLCSAWRAIKQMAGRIKPRVLLANFIYPDAWAGLQAAERLGIPLVAQCLGSDILVAGEDPVRGPLVREVLERAAGVMVKTQGLFDAAVKLGADPGKLRLVPNGVDQERFCLRDRAACRRELGIGPDGEVVAFVGNLLPVKNPMGAIKAVAQRKNATLLVIGEGPLWRESMDLAAKLDMGDRVIFMGAQPHEGVALALGACDALILPSLSEGDPNVVLEALASGRPVAASRVGGAAELVQDGEQGYLAPPGDELLLFRALAKALDQDWDPAAIRAKVAGRTWPISARKLYDLLAAAANAPQDE